MNDAVRDLDPRSFDSVGQLIRAADEAKAFAEEEGWASGPLWDHAGSLWLRWGWLRHHGENLDEWNKSFEWFKMEPLRRFKQDIGDGNGESGRPSSEP